MNSGRESLESAVHTESVLSGRTTARQWSSVVVLTLCTFVVVTSELLPVGVLTPMASGLGIGTGAAGLSLTVTGIVAAVAAPATPRLSGSLDRRGVVAAAMLLVATANAMTALSNDFIVLMVSRIVLGVGMGAVWGLSAALAVRLVRPEKVGTAVSLVLSGVAAASVVGVPSTTALGDLHGWRTAFVATAAVAALLVAALFVVLPPIPAPGKTAAQFGVVDDSRRGKPLGRNRTVVIGLSGMAILVTAHFAVYTHVRSIVEDIGLLASGSVAAMLLVYGAFGFLGNFGAGAAAVRQPRNTASVLAVGITVSLALLPFIGSTPIAVVAVLSLWGLSYGGLSVTGQLWMTTAAPDRIEQVTGLYVGVFTASIGIGALVGGVILEAVGIGMLPWLASVIALPAVILLVVGASRSRRSPTAR